MSKVKDRACCSNQNIKERPSILPENFVELSADRALRGSGVAVLIPCYNEAATIAKVVGDFRAALPEATVYVYDNASTDGTADIGGRQGGRL